MPTHKLLLLPGDGIGPEVMAEVKQLIDWMNKRGLGRFETEESLVGGAASLPDSLGQLEHLVNGLFARQPGDVVAAKPATHSPAVHASVARPMLGSENRQTRATIGAAARPLSALTAVIAKTSVRPFGFARAAALTVPGSRPAVVDAMKK